MIRVPFPVRVRATIRVWFSGVLQTGMPASELGGGELDLPKKTPPKSLKPAVIDVCCGAKSAAPKLSDSGGGSFCGGSGVLILLDAQVRAAQAASTSRMMNARRGWSLVRTKYRATMPASTAATMPRRFIIRRGLPCPPPLLCRARLSCVRVRPARRKSGSIGFGNARNEPARRQASAVHPEARCR